MTSAEAWFNIALRPRKPEGSLGRTAQDGHLDSHAAPELCSVAGQLHGDKECPFSGVTKSGRVWRKVPESDARSVCGSFITLLYLGGALYGPDRFLAHTLWFLHYVALFRWCIVW